jgi:transposase
MRGDEKQQGGMFSYVSIEERVPADHPLRVIRRLVDQILARMSKRFDKMYADNGRPSIPPERLLRALLLPTFYSIRSERMLMEQLDYNLLFRWFVGLEMDEPVWNHAVFSKNRERLLNETVAREFFAEVLEQAKPHLSQEHFTVDGTMIEAWASQKSFQRKDGGDSDSQGTASFHGDKRTNETHASKTDPDARLYKKSRGSEAKLSYLGHVMGGEPARVHRGGDADAGRRNGGSRCSDLDGGYDAKEKAWPAFHIGSGQGVRQPGLSRDLAGDERHAARGAKQQESP